MSRHDVGLDGSEDENGGFALGTIFTVSRKSLPSVLPHRQHLRVDASAIANPLNNSFLSHYPHACTRICVTGARSSTIARTDDRGVRKHRKPQR